MTITRTMRHAFTLIELSIGLTILSLLAAGALTVGGVLVEQQQFTGSNERVMEAKKALVDYFNVNGRLPCPASPSLAAGAPGFGSENADNAGSANNCDDGGAATGGIIRVDGSGTFSGAAYSPGVVRIGVLPVRALGLRDSAMADEYGNRLRYAVSEQFTQAGAAPTSDGAITLIDGAGNVIASAGSNNGAVFALLSHGADGKGAYRYQTGALERPCGASANLDVENCNANITLRDTRFNNGSVAGSFFDDMLTWSPKYLLLNDANNTLSVGSNKEVIYNNNGVMDGASMFFWDAASNRVGIGTALPTARLSVASPTDIGVSVTSTNTVGVQVSNSAAHADNKLQLFVETPGTGVLNYGGTSETNDALDLRVENVPIATIEPAGMSLSPGKTLALDKEIKTCNATASCDCSSGFQLITGGARAPASSAIVESRPADFDTWTAACVDLMATPVGCTSITIICARMTN